jgi:hypothetical protein
MKIDFLIHALSHSFPNSLLFSPLLFFHHALVFDVSKNQPVL